MFTLQGSQLIQPCLSSNICGCCSRPFDHHRLEHCLSSMRSAVWAFDVWWEEASDHSHTPVTYSRFDDRLRHISSSFVADRQTHCTVELPYYHLRFRRHESFSSHSTASAVLKRPCQTQTKTPGPKMQQASHRPHTTPTPQHSTPAMCPHKTLGNRSDSRPHISHKGIHGLPLLSSRVNSIRTLRLPVLLQDRVRRSHNSRHPQTRRVDWCQSRSVASSEKHSNILSCAVIDHSRRTIGTSRGSRKSSPVSTDL